MTSIFKNVLRVNNARNNTKKQRPNVKQVAKTQGSSTRRKNVAKFQKAKRQANINARRMGSNPKQAMKNVKKPKLSVTKQSAAAKKRTKKQEKIKLAKKQKLVKNKENAKKENSTKPKNKTKKLAKKPTNAKQNKGTKKKAAKPPTADDLDMEMAEYWFKVGKGEDPKLLALNKQMEQYWAERKAKEAAEKEAKEQKEAAAKAEAAKVEEANKLEVVSSESAKEVLVGN